MEHKGYKARIDYDPEDHLFTGRIAGINDVVSFHGKTVDELEAAFHEAVDDYLATCRAAGKEPEREFTGQLSVRISPQAHRAAAVAAQLEGVSLNKWAEKVMTAAARRTIDDADGR